MSVEPFDVVLGSVRSLADRAGLPASFGSFTADGERELRSLPLDTQRAMVATLICGAGVPNWMTPADVVSSLRGCSVEEAQTLKDACGAVLNAKSDGEVALLETVCGWSEERASAALTEAVAHAERSAQRADVIMGPPEILAASLEASSVPEVKEWVASLPFDVQCVLAFVAVLRTGVPADMTPAHVVASLRGCSVREAEELELECAAVQAGADLQRLGVEDHYQLNHARMLAAVCGWTEERAQAALAEAQRLGLIAKAPAPPAPKKTPPFRTFVKPRSKKDRRR